jgi:hypothetical protein
VKFDALRRASSRLWGLVFAMLTTLTLTSCGGGGATTVNEVNGSLTLLPAAASLYAGIPYTFQIAGGRAPYLLSSSEPVLLPVPPTVEGHSFQVVPNNPGVIDANLPANSLPIRSVVITVRDSTGTVISTATTNGITVGVNFLTGYGVAFTTPGCQTEACAGQESIVNLRAVFAGSLFGGRTFRFCVVRGDYQFVVPESPSNPTAQLVNCVDTTSDHNGNALARIRVTSGAPTQLATLRVIDVTSGVFVDEVFTITAASPATQTQITIIPNDFTFTGPRAGVCGTGTSDFFVFDGTPPYQAFSSSPLVGVIPVNTGSNPGRFTIQISDPTQCVDHATIVVIDSAGRRATVTVSSTAGSATNPPLAVAPTTTTLNDTCGFSSSVTAVGGQGPLSVSSNNPAVSAVLSGGTVTITRRLHDPAPPPASYPLTATVSVTDGTTIQNVTVNGVNAFCP